MKPLLIVPLALLVAFAGCLGPEGDQPVDPQTTGPETPGPGDVGDVGNDTVEEPGLSWQNETVSGSVTTVNVLGAVSFNPAGEPPKTFQMPANGVQLVIDLAVTGGDLDMLVAAPGCDPDVLSGCEERVSSSGGTATYTAKNPEAGEWNLRFFGNGPGLNQVDYEAAIGKMIEAPAA